MGLTDETQRELVARARSLGERLGTADGDVAEMDREAVIDDWRETLGEDAFEARLSRTDSTLPEGLAARRPTGELPAWVAVVAELTETVTPPARSLESWPVEPAEPDPPFEQLLVAVTEFAVGRVIDDVSLSDRAVYDAATGLFDRLGELFQHPLFIEFKHFLQTSEVGVEGEASSTAGYETFVIEQLSDGLASFFVEYPVAARWTGTAIRQWTASLREFADRLAADRDRLADSFDGAVGSVVGLTPHGDRHHDGRRVFEVTFESGTRIAYKPRSLEPETNYYRFLSWVNDTSRLPTLRTVGCLPRDGYGWMEWVTPGDCPDEAAVARYYERAGVLICLLYALRFADGNLENVVAAGEQPLLLDMEALAHPSQPPRFQFGEPTYSELIDESVLSTGLVAIHMRDSDVAHTAGFDKPTGQQTNLPLPEFESPNTDAMELVYTTDHEIESDGLARHDGELVDPREHAESLIGGFEAAYDFLLETKSTLLAADGPLGAFEHQPVRLIVRDTATYSRAGQPLRRSPQLRSGAVAGAEIEALASWLDWPEPSEPLWGLYEAERAALWRFEIPRLTVAADETTVRADDRRLPDALDESPFAQLRARIRSLDPADRRQQAELLRVAYDPDPLISPQPPTTGYVDDQTMDWPSVAREECRTVLDRLDAAATRRSDGVLEWYQRENTNDAAEFRPLREDIYDGRMGIALFTGALAREYGWQRAHELCEEALAPLIEQLGDGPSAFEPKYGVAHGMASLVYGFTKLGAWLDTDRYTAVAHRLGTFLTPERVGSDDVFDLIGGTAGSICGLLTLWEATDDRAVLNRAVALGDQLLAQRTRIDGTLAWETYAGPQRALVGAGHGIAGISYALDRLTEASGDDRFRAAGREALAFEESHYTDDHHGWPDFRFDTCRDGWCAGRAGIGLTRLTAHQAANDERLWRDTQRVLETVEIDPLMTEDDICCGNFSTVELLTTAADALDEPSYRTAAERLATGVVRRARERNGYSVAWQTDTAYSASLFLGEMGIAYSLLRLAGSDLPLLLLWE